MIKIMTVIIIIIIIMIMIFSLKNDGSQAVTELREAFDIFYVDGENSRLPCINNENRNAFQEQN